MLRWITEFIKENEERWEKEFDIKMKKERNELEEWNKSKRLEKIQKLKEKWRKNKEAGEIENNPSSKNDDAEKAALVGASDNSQMYLNAENRCCKNTQKKS